MNDKADLLNRGKFIDKIKEIVKFLADKKQHCCFAIDGTWGSGKTFILEKLEKEIKLVATEEMLDDKYLVFHYDCWKYDYYEEPVIAIVAAMQDIIKEEFNVFSEDVHDKVNVAWKTAKNVLTKIASKICENKIGVDLVEIAKETLIEHDDCKKKDNEFDSLYGFKRALDETREGIKKIAETKTVVIVVDELDRCLPLYAIKVLERLHHVFKDIDNVIVIISMDKSQLSHSIQGIYGDIEVDKYLRKFISFRVKLDNGTASQYFKKYQSYVSMFETTVDEQEEIEDFFEKIMWKIDMRSQERIFEKAEIIHNIIKDKELEESSILGFEILVLTSMFILKSKNTSFFAHAKNNPYSDAKIQNLYDICDNIKANMKKSMYNLKEYYDVGEWWQEKMIFWLVKLDTEYKGAYAQNISIQ